MPALTLLSWNIRTLGPSKVGEFEADDRGRFVPYTGRRPRPPQMSALLRTIGENVEMLGADIVSVLEVCGSTAAGFRKLFLRAVKKTTFVNWTVQLVPSNKNDVYFIAYRRGRGFDVLRDSNGQVVKGLTHKDIDGNDLNFASSTVGRGGRWPGYVAFRTTAGTIFTVICYHACKGGNNQDNGIINIANVAPVRQIVVDGVDTPVPVSVVSGDFNVNYLTSPAAYTNVTNAAQGWAATPAVPFASGDNAKTSLVRDNPAAAAPTSLTFRVNAYDNIFAHNSALSEGQVQDTINEFVNPVGGGGGLSSLQQCAGRFDINTLNARLAIRPQFGKVTTNPPTNVTDAWRIYYRIVSDHLPVYATFDV
ncbi:MAG TPA: hypothetical protein VJ464_14970 [Blastocatellia bacterium]|nr:hypothetical protein [Blastocatellia bacterium]